VGGRKEGWACTFQLLAIYKHLCGMLFPSPSLAELRPSGRRGCVGKRVCSVPCLSVHLFIGVFFFFFGVGRTVFLFYSAIPLLFQQRLISRPLPLFVASLACVLCVSASGRSLSAIYRVVLRDGARPAIPPTQNTYSLQNINEQNGTAPAAAAATATRPAAPARPRLGRQGAWCAAGLDPKGRKAQEDRDKGPQQPHHWYVGSLSWRVCLLTPAATTQQNQQRSQRTAEAAAEEEEEEVAWEEAWEAEEASLPVACPN